MQRRPPMRISLEALSEISAPPARADERPAIPFAESPELAVFLAQAAARGEMESGGVIRWTP